MNLTNVKAVARKEYYHLIRDFRSLYLAFFIPLFLILMFGYALSLDVDNVETIVVDYDNTPLSRDLIRKIDASPYFEVIRWLSNTRQLTEYIDSGKAKLGIVIPSGWTEDMRADRETPVQFILDGSDPNYAGISRGYVTAFVQDYNQHMLVDFINRQGQKQIKTPVEARIRIWFNEELESRYFIVPGIIAIIIMIVGALLTSLVIAREYENGTMETIRSLPIRAEEFLLGKAAPYFFIAMLDVFVAVLMGQVLFGTIIKSSFWLMVMASAIYLGVALSLGLLISSVAKSQQVANQLAILATYLPSILLSNFVFPVINMPKALQLITKIIPATYYIDIMNGLYLRGVGIQWLWKNYVVLAIMFVVIGSLNILALRKEGL
ncbi:MAG: ABC transporter permease [Deltaproteobacteria bacterium]|nr:ABC transporter permease [Deltaproteobacteria bacterium]MBW2081787.1 ABC transporter permease [Deltaproteobacteria bacterium]